MHEENNTVGWFHPTSGDSRSVPRGFHSRLIGIYRTIRHFYNIPGHWPPFSNALRVCTALKRHLNFVSFIVAPFFLLFRGRCSNAGVWVWTRDICIYIYFSWQREIFITVMVSRSERSAITDSVKTLLILLQRITFKNFYFYSVSFN